MKKFSYTIYWILQWTWGFIMTFIGGVAALGLILTGHKPHALGPNVYFTIGRDWGGVSFGPFFFCCENVSNEILYHESGHSLQNIIWGPLMPFAIGIPSFVRYHLRNQPTRIKKNIFNFSFLIISFLFFSMCIGITGVTFHLHILTHFLEFLRDYLICISIWLTLVEIPKYDCGQGPDYDDIWFEGQATRWGMEVFKKKED